MFAIPDDFLRQVLPAERKKALEIGCFRGDSTCKLASLFESVTCVDPWDDEYVKDKPNFSITPRETWVGQFDKFKAATAKVQEKLILRRGYSQDILPTLQETFDFILVDGDHSTEAVRTDARESHRLIAGGGVILFDDYNWRGKLGPRPAIDEFLAEHKDEYAILHRGARVAVRRL